MITETADGYVTEVDITPEPRELQVLHSPMKDPEPEAEAEI